MAYTFSPEMVNAGYKFYQDKVAAYNVLATEARQLDQRYRQILSERASTGGEAANAVLTAQANQVRAQYDAKVAEANAARSAYDEQWKVYTSMRDTLSREQKAQAAAQQVTTAQAQQAQATAAANAGATTNRLSSIDEYLRNTASTDSPNDDINGDGTPDDDIVVVGRRPTTAPSATAAPAAPRGTDERVRIYAPDGQEINVYGPNEAGNILRPLYRTRGLMFPYTPTIQVSGESNWESLNLVHTNYDILSYQRTPSASISITGKFTVQNQREGEYALAAIHFLRTVTKMYYGRSDDDAVQNGEDATQKGRAGLPPPVLRLEGYGDYMFNGLRVVVKGFSYNLDDSQDMIKITTSGGSVWLPPLLTMNVTLGMQQSPLRAGRQFNLSKFRTGELLRSPQSGWF